MSGRHDIMKFTTSLTLVLAVAFAIALSGCGGDSQSNAGGPQEDLLGPTGSTGLMDRTAKSISAAAEDYYVSCKKSAETMTDDAQQARALVRCNANHVRARDAAKKRIELMRTREKYCIESAKAEPKESVKKQMLAACTKAAAVQTAP